MTHRLNETFDVGIATLLRGIQLLANHVVGVVLKILQREVFEFALQLVETQLVGEGCKEIGCFLANAMLGVLVVGVANLSHEVHPVGYHDQDDTHVFGKRQQQIAEVLAFNDWTFLIEVADA